MKRPQNAALEDAASLVCPDEARYLQTNMMKTLSFIQQLIEDVPRRACY